MAPLPTSSAKLSSATSRSKLSTHAIFTTIYKGSTVLFTTDRVKFLRPDVALVDVTARLSGVASFPPGIKPNPDGSIDTKLQLVLTRESGTWWIAAFHNVTVIPLPPRP